jgi:LmbE family N-acetylglucosaminyl deacetylase
MTKGAAIAIAAHPDDIEFMMAGTLRLLGEAGYETHYLNVATGSCGGTEHSAAQLTAIRRREAAHAAAVLGAQYHRSRVNDLEILYSVPLLRWLTGVIREVRPSIVLTHSPEDYMEDHTNTGRLAVTAAFARGMPNFRSSSRGPVWTGDVAVYHAMPHRLSDGWGRPITAETYVDVAAVHARKLEALACHASQQGWLRTTQGMNSYLADMERISREVGRMSGRFKLAEGWRRHAPLGFGPADFDPLRAALGRRIRMARRKA